MRTLLEILREFYDKLMAKCPAAGEEHKILSTGILIPRRNDDDSEMIVIFCEPEQVKLIVDSATRFYAEAVPEIKEYTYEFD